MIKLLGKMMKGIMGVALAVGLFFLGGAEGVEAETYDLDSFQPTNVTVEADPGEFINGVVNVVFVVAIILAFAFLVYGGVGWIMAGGDKTKLETAQKRMIQAVIGLLILAAIWALFSLIMQVGFGGENVEMPTLEGPTLHKFDKKTDFGI